MAKAKQEQLEPVRCESGKLLCPLCKNELIKNQRVGYHCGVPGNKYDHRDATWSICNYSWFPNKSFNKRVEVVRPEHYPLLPKITAQQEQAIIASGAVPAERGFNGICLDAGAGCGKTSTGALCLEHIIARLGQHGVKALCFNVNAKISFQEKTPEELKVYTLNGLGANLQGYTFKKFKKYKLTSIFYSLTAHLRGNDQPSNMGMNAIIERMRDLMLFNINPYDHKWWRDAIAYTTTRFPGTCKHYIKNSDAIHDYLPLVYTSAHQQSEYIDLQEQWSRPVCDAIARLGWKMPWHLTNRDAKWSDTDIAHLVELVKAIKLPQQRAIFVDEAQDLSLGQIAFCLALARGGELYFVGDDEVGEYGKPGFKCGQTIYAWRGAFGGGMSVMERTREALGNKSKRMPLSITFRCPQNIVAGIKGLNSTLESRKPGGVLRQVVHEDAFDVWCKTKKNAYWITRTNKAAAEVLLATLRKHKTCTLRGTDMGESFGNILYQCAGWKGDNGEYKIKLPEAMSKLQESIGDTEADCPEAFVYAIMEAIQTDPKLLKEAMVPCYPTVGNVHRFLDYLVDAESNRCVTNVYRIKGEERPIVIVSDAEQFNKAWNDDAREARAARFVAVTRASEVCLLVGEFLDIVAEMGKATDEGKVGEPKYTDMRRVPAVMRRQNKPVFAVSQVRSVVTPVRSLLEPAKPAQRVFEWTDEDLPPLPPEVKATPATKVKQKPVKRKKGESVVQERFKKMTAREKKIACSDLDEILAAENDEAAYLRAKNYKDWTDDELEELRTLLVD